MRTVRKFLCSLALCTAAGMFVCCDGGNTDVVTPNTDLSGLFENNKGIESDFESGIIEVPAGVDSLVIEDASSLGGAQCYLSLDDDIVDPEIDWDSPVEDGTVLDLANSDFVNIVVLDDENQIVKVWQIVQREGKSSAKSSSSSEKASSSSKEKSSSSDKPKSSSSEASSSSEEAPESSAEESSSSEEPASSSEEVESSSSDAPESSSSEEVSSSSTVVEVQLPGSDFSSRNDFWATTSDAMATKKTAALITISSQANLSFDDGMATVTTREVEGSLLFDGSWKMASGFYFSGSYVGESALDIYEQGYESGTPSTSCSDISKDMTFGKPFTARPVAFELKYSYNHVSNKSTDYPQKSLVYVMLVGKGGKVVATGAFSDETSVEMSTRTVKLSYGKDPFGLLDGEYPVAEGLTLGKGTEDVTSIHVMFASSAYAHVVCGGTLLEGGDKKYRGAENASLVLDNFKLIY